MFSNNWYLTFDDLSFFSVVELSRNSVKFFKQSVVEKNAAFTDVLERMETFLVIL